MRQKTIYPKGTKIVVNALDDGRIEVVVNSPSPKKALAADGSNGNNTRNTGSLGNQPGAKG